MSYLLSVTRVGKDKLPKKGAVLALECVVSPDTAPYLVTSSKGLVWVGDCTPDQTINAAVRLRTTPDQFFRDVVEAVHTAGLELAWGNVVPMCESGVQEALSHVETYEVGALEILVPMQPSARMLELTRHLGCPTRPCSWLPLDLMVVVPKDRGFVGAVYRVTPKDIVGVVHNAARGMALVSGRVSVEPEVALDDVAG